MKYVKKSSTAQTIVYEIAQIEGATAANVNKYHLEVINTSTGSKTIHLGTATLSTGVAASSGNPNTHFKFSVPFKSEGAYVVSLIGSTNADLDSTSELTTIYMDTVFAVVLSGTYTSGGGIIEFD